MGLDIKLKATLPVVGKDRAGNEIKTELKHYFDCISIPTEEINKIMASDDITFSYKKYLLDNYDKDVEEEEYDIFGEEVIGAYISNMAKDHIARLDEFLFQYEDWYIVWFTD